MKKFGQRNMSSDVISGTGWRFFEKITFMFACFLASFFKLCKFWKLDIKLNLFLRVFNVSEFWFRPEVTNPNHLNLGNILLIFDIYNNFFAHEYWFNCGITSIVYATTSYLSLNLENKIFSIHVSNLGHPKKRSKIHKLL